MPNDNTYEKAKEILEKWFPHTDCIDEEMILGIKRMIENPGDAKLIHKRAYLMLKHYLEGESFSRELIGRVIEWFMDPANSDIKEDALQMIAMETYFKEDEQPHAEGQSGYMERFEESRGQTKNID